MSRRRSPARRLHRRALSDRALADAVGGGGFYSPGGGRLGYMHTQRMPDGSSFDLKSENVLRVGNTVHFNDVWLFPGSKADGSSVEIKNRLGSMLPALKSELSDVGRQMGGSQVELHYKRVDGTAKVVGKEVSIGWDIGTGEFYRAEVRMPNAEPVGKLSPAAGTALRGGVAGLVVTGGIMAIDESHDWRQEHFSEPVNRALEAIPEAARVVTSGPAPVFPVFNAVQSVVSSAATPYLGETGAKFAALPFATAAEFGATLATGGAYGAYNIAAAAGNVLYAGQEKVLSLWQENNADNVAPVAAEDPAALNLALTAGNESLGTTETPDGATEAAAKSPEYSYLTASNGDDPEALAYSAGESDTPYTDIITHHTPNGTYDTTSSGDDPDAVAWSAGQQSADEPRYEDEANMPADDTPAPDVVTGAAGTEDDG